MLVVIQVPGGQVKGGTERPSIVKENPKVRNVKQTLLVPKIRPVSIARGCKRERGEETRKRRIDRRGEGGGLEKPTV